MRPFRRRGAAFQSGGARQHLPDEGILLLGDVHWDGGLVPVRRGLQQRKKHTLNDSDQKLSEVVRRGAVVRFVRGGLGVRKGPSPAYPTVSDHYHETREERKIRSMTIFLMGRRGRAGAASRKSRCLSPGRTGPDGPGHTLQNSVKRGRAR